MQQQLENKRGGDLVREVGHTHVKERQIAPQDISHYHFQFLSCRAVG
jgi:hypothetical protein